MMAQELNEKTDVEQQPGGVTSLAAQTRFVAPVDCAQTVHRNMQQHRVADSTQQQYSRIELTHNCPDHDTVVGSLT
jgi:hypothetical protein